MKKITRTAILFAFTAAVLTACGGGGEKPAEDAGEETSSVEASMEQAVEEAEAAAEMPAEEPATEPEPEMKEAEEMVDEAPNEKTEPMELKKEPKAQKRGAGDGETNVATKRGGQVNEEGEVKNKASKR